jgi:hypothetical protein
MKKRILFRLSVLAFLALAGFACYLWLAPGGGINRMSVLRIRGGMGPEQVEAVIGLPHGGRGIIAGRGEFRQWCGDSGMITVWFDEAGTVTERHFWPSVPSFFDRIYRWIGIDRESSFPPPPPLPLMFPVAPQEP